MTIFNKSLIITSCLLAFSLSQAEEVAPTQILENITAEKKYTALQAMGAYVYAEGLAYYRTGNRLINNGLDELKLKKYFWTPQTPKGMKQYGLLALSVGSVGIVSPFIFAKVEEMGKQYREDKINEWQEKMALLENNQEDEPQDN